MLTDYVVSGIERHDLVTDSTLHVVAPISNPARYHSRYRIFREWVDHMNATPNVKLHVVELAFGDRHFEVTGRAASASELQLRSPHELWHKENLINLGVRHLLPQNWKYVAWVDGDVFFNTPNWALEAIHQLQHYAVVQPWSECADQGPHGNTLQLYRSFCGLVQRGVRQQVHKNEPYPYGHSGFAWACTRRFWENVGGLMDFPILGSADHHMAWAMIGQVDKSVHQGTCDAFKRRCDEWQRLAYRETQGHVASIPGTLAHRFHGPKNKRYYRERWQILVQNKFDPDRDLCRDSQGLLYIQGKPALEEDVRRYMRARQEDSIEEE